MVEMDSTDKSLDVPELTEDQKPLYNKVQVSDIVRREKEKARERGKQEALEAFSQKPQVETAITQPQQPQTMGGMPAVNMEDIRKMMREEVPAVLQNHAQLIENRQVADSFVQKIQAAESKYPGLEARVGKLNVNGIAPLIRVINNSENTAEIMKELLDNPMKLGNLAALAHMQPDLVPEAINSLANSIKQNLTAQANDIPVNEPLDRVKSSNLGMDNGSHRSVRDFTEKYRGKL